MEMTTVTVTVTEREPSANGFIWSWSCLHFKTDTTSYLLWTCAALGPNISLSSLVGRLRVRRVPCSFLATRARQRLPF
jgi:hypothetical protein